MKNAPSLFVSHGAPTFALEPGLLGPKLEQLGEQLADLAAVAVISAHWQTAGVRVMQTAAPETLHDFGGFPEALYQLRYPAPGAPLIASDTAALLKTAGIEASLDDGRGLVVPAPRGTGSRLSGFDALRSRRERSLAARQGA